jgi:hypothetical protein
LVNCSDNNSNNNITNNDNNTNNSNVISNDNDNTTATNTTSNTRVISIDSISNIDSMEEFPTSINTSTPSNDLSKPLSIVSNDLSIASSGMETLLDELTKSGIKIKGIYLSIYLYNIHYYYLSNSHIYLTIYLSIYLSIGNSKVSEFLQDEEEILTTDDTEFKAKKLIISPIKLNSGDNSVDNSVDDGNDDVNTSINSNGTETDTESFVLLYPSNSDNDINNTNSNTTNDSNTNTSLSSDLSPSLSAPNPVLQLPNPVLQSPNPVLQPPNPVTPTGYKSAYRRKSPTSIDINNSNKDITNNGIHSNETHNKFLINNDINNKVLINNDINNKDSNKDTKVDRFHTSHQLFDEDVVDTGSLCIDVNTLDDSRNRDHNYTINNTNMNNINNINNDNDSNDSNRQFVSSIRDRSISTSITPISYKSLITGI